MVGRYIQQSEVINELYDCDYINLSTSTSLNEIGKGGINKIIALLNIQFKVIKLLLTKKYSLCYMTLTAAPPGFYKDLFILILFKLFRKKIVYHFHNKGVDEASQISLNNKLYKFSFKNTYSILLSPSLFKDVSRFVGEDKVFYCANGIPEIKDDILLIPASVASKSPPPVRLLFLSNMMIEKGVQVLLDACKILAEEQLPFECHFVGPWSGITEEEFNSKVAEYGIRDYVFGHGKKYGDDKIVFFHQSDIFVFPTYYYNECFPLVLLEAMQYGLPILSTYEGGIPDIIVQGETGFIIKQHDVVTLAEKIKFLIKNTQIRVEMGLKAQTRYEELYTIQKFEDQFCKTLKSII